MNDYYTYNHLNPNIPIVRKPVTKLPPSDMAFFVMGYKFAFALNSELVPADAEKAKLFYWGMRRAMTDLTIRRAKGKRTPLMIAVINQA